MSDREDRAAVAPFEAVASQLVDVAMGRKPADLVVKAARWVNVHSGEILPNTDIAVAAGRFAYCGPDASHAVGPQTVVVEAQGRYVVPGLCDAHMHVESGMVTVTEFCRAVIPHGTTSMFIDPHEIANVLGLDGVRLMHDEALTQPVNVWVEMPSCVPSAPGLEEGGAVLGPTEVAEAMGWPGIIGLGEVMNFPGVANNDATMVGEIAATWAAHKTVGGHFASPDLGRAFHGYVAGGPEDDHEGTRMEDAAARVRQGMKAMLRLGSAWYDVAEQVRAITEMGLDSRHFILCTDDCHSGTLVREGHMNRVVRHAISRGLKPMTAIQMATINTAEHFKLEREIGSVTPGRRADFLIVSNLAELTIDAVYGRGVRLAASGRLEADLPVYPYPKSAIDTVRLGRALSAEDFRVMAPRGAGATVDVRVIGVVENQAPTRALTATLKVRDQVVMPDADQDICRIALVERHRGSGTLTNGFVSGFGYRGRCAMASTVAHDSHHMIVVGTSEADMALAANRLGAVGGGVVFFADGVEQALVEMPIAGLMSNERAEIVAEKADRLIAAMRAAGCELNNAYMQHSLLALVVIPALRISDKGIVDVDNFQIVDLIV
ncbi:adenine deaminase [Jiella sp. MQZ9-1]|uniref:Adenine deaminase n=1 Tax=Jiella flava TaxID=2816857 RepID=A0A939JW83_9HYPH|nr:adenine deaminase [Jiella flava]MBO0662031.1 adenine deaminase [Jiella flava]MCD2470642.1 adenine deaminase [Jiella flava]